MELWLDCRGCKGAALPAAPPGCSRRLLPEAAGSGAATRGEDLTWHAESKQLQGARGEVVGVVHEGAAALAQREALAAVGSVAWVVLAASDGAVCVLAENLIAASRRTGTRVAVVAATEQQVAGLAGALQLGVDALVVAALAETGLPDEQLWAQALKAQQARERALHRSPADGAAAMDSAAIGLVPDQLVAARVASIETAAGLADRVCLDFIQLLHEGEGALVGSTAKALCFVYAETVETGLVPPRPFRINAGPVHAYVALADGRTKYLSEIAAGDEVLVVDASNVAAGVIPQSRVVVVGRCKIEPRPVLLVQFSSGERTGQLFLQQAETVRLRARRASGLAAGGGWTPVAVTDLQVEDEVLVRFADEGTHVGRRIAASVVER